MKTRVRAISYFLSIIAIAAIFFSVEHFVEKFFFRNDDLVDITAAITAAVSFSECRRFFDVATDRIFFRGPRDARAEFLVNISHELQTPIAILRGNIEVLQSKDIGDSERISAERVIVTTLDGMSRLIGNVLESAKVKFSQKVFYEQDIFVGALLREVQEDCLILAEDKGIQLLVDFEVGEVGEILSVYGNRDRLKEVLFNLISNALKHTDAGGRIALRAKRSSTSVRITVEDSGCGIAPAELSHIFERFYRIKDDGIFAVPGTGIGLNICREIVEAHKGTIIAESELGKGSRFIICLPLSTLSVPSPPTGEATPDTTDSRAVSAIINS